MYCSVMQSCRAGMHVIQHPSPPYAFTCCSAFKCITASRSVLQRVAVIYRREAQRHTAPLSPYTFTCCSVLQCVAACCSMLQCFAVCCSLLQSCTGEKRSVIRHLFPVLKACPNFSKVSSILIGYIVNLLAS